MVNGKANEARLRRVTGNLRRLGVECDVDFPSVAEELFLAFGADLALDFAIVTLEITHRNISH
jgi:hypothetical protein